MDRKVTILAFIVGLLGKRKANTQSLEGLMAEGLIFVFCNIHFTRCSVF